MKYLLFPALLLVAILCWTSFSDAAQPQAGQNTALNPRQQAMVAISAFSGNGDLPNLKIALAEGLEAGLTVNEIKEILVQVYAYAGFPRSLNAIGTFMALLEERKQHGMLDELGNEPSPLPTDKTSLVFGTENQTQLIGRHVAGGVYDFVPAIDQFLKAHLFGDIFQRDNLDWLSREIVTISILASIEGLNPQLQGHYNTAMRNGLTPDQAGAFVELIAARVGKKAGDNAGEVLQKALQQ